jgi:hypothetical protein
MAQELYDSTTDKAFGDKILRLTKENNRLLSEVYALLKQNQGSIARIDENPRKKSQYKLDRIGLVSL